MFRRYGFELLLISLILCGIITACFYL
ncbi:MULTISPECIES: small membrane protein YdgU [Hafniaceae]